MNADQPTTEAKSVNSGVVRYQSSIVKDKDWLHLADLINIHALNTQLNNHVDALIFS